MPDATIPLQITGAAPPSAAATPLDTISKFATIQNALNQNQLFQQTFTARQMAGQIIAAAPDLKTGLANLYQNPSTAAFAGEIINNIRQAELTGMTLAKTKQEMTQGALGNGIKMLVGVMGDPSQYGALRDAGRAAVSPDVMPEYDKAFSSIDTALSQGLPQGNDAQSLAKRNQMIQSRAAGLLMGAGAASPEVINRFTGVPAMPSTGGLLQPGAVAPVWGGQGGAFAPSGAPLAVTPTPRVEVSPLNPQGAPAPVQLGGVGGAGGVGAPGQTPNALGASPPSSTAPAGPGMTSGAYLKQRGDDMAAYQKSLDERVSIGTTIMQTVQEAKDALQQVRAGGGATAYARLAQIAQAFGAKNETVDKIANGDLAASQEFAKLMVNTTMGQIKEQLPAGGSRLSQMEFKTFQENNPNLDTDPRAVDKIFNFWTRLYNRDSMEQQELNNHLGGGGDLSAWPAKWQQIMRDRGVIGTSTSAAGSQRPAAKEWRIEGGKLVPTEGAH